LRAPQSDQFYRFLNEVRRAQRSYQRSGHSRVPQRTAICMRAEMSAYQIDGCWQSNAGRRYALLQSTAPLALRDFRRVVSETIAKERDRRVLRCLKQLRYEPATVTAEPPDLFPTIARAWANFRMQMIDQSIGEPRAISDAQRKEARVRSLSNLSACYLLMCIDEGYRNPNGMLEIANAALAYPPP